MHKPSPAHPLRTPPPAPHHTLPPVHHLHSLPPAPHHTLPPVHHLHSLPPAPHHTLPPVHHLHSPTPALLHRPQQQRLPLAPQTATPLRSPNPLAPLPRVVSQHPLVRPPSHLASSPGSPAAGSLNSSSSSSSTLAVIQQCTAQAALSHTQRSTSTDNSSAPARPQLQRACPRRPGVATCVPQGAPWCTSGCMACWVTWACASNNSLSWRRGPGSRMKALCELGQCRLAVCFSCCCYLRGLLTSDSPAARACLTFRLSPFIPCSQTLCPFIPCSQTLPKRARGSAYTRSWPREGFALWGLG